MYFQRVKLLQQVYKSVEDIDLYIGMTSEETSEPKALAGATFACLIGDQFARLKWGDRFYYDLSNQKGSFDQCNVFHFYNAKVILIIQIFSVQLNEIRKTSLARLICDNSKNIKEIQPLALKTSKDRRYTVSTSFSSNIHYLS